MSFIRSDRVASRMMLSVYPPQILAYMVTSLNALISSLLVGNLMGSECLAVFGFIVPLKRIQLMLCSSIAAGSQILCGRFMGSGDSKKIGAAFAAVSELCIVIGAVMTILYFCFPMQIASVLGASGNAQILVADYLRSFSWGMIFMLFSSSMIPFLQINNAPKILTASVLVMTAVNFGGNLLNIYILKLDMFGCGLVSTAGYFFSFLVILIYYLSGKCSIRLNFHTSRWSFIKGISVLGFPSLIYPFCQIWRDLLINNTAVRLSGTMAIAALAIMENVVGIIGTVIDAMPDTISMSTSIFYGERDKKSLRDVTSIGLRYGLLFAFLAYALVFALASPISRLFGVEPKMISFVASSLRVILLYFVVGAPFFIVLGEYRGLGRTKLVSIITVIDSLIVPILACMILSRLFGINGTWCAFFIGDFVSFVLLLFYSAKKLGRFPKKLTELVYIPETFGTSDENRLNAVIRSTSDASEISQRVIDFCREKALGGRLSFYCGLCVEEIAVAILEHGFKALNGKTRGREIDVRIICENGGLSMIIRDNYPNFDPTQWAKLCEPQDLMRSMGIRTVMKLAKSVEYSLTLNLNLISIRIGD